MKANSRCRRPVRASLEELRLHAVLDGPNESAETLVARLMPRVRNLVRYTVRGDSDVDDITQDALIAILRGLPSYRGEGAFASWADRVVGRVTFAASKRARAERTLLHSEEEGAELELPRPDGDEPEDCLLRRQMERLLDKLSEEQRRALLLHHVMGMSVPEMAEELEVPFETVRSRLRLGKAHLRELLYRQVDREAEALL
ncbi:RNA polymerase sigma factor [Archangium primigenium]|uniref:RNA polymerase sigma factor n=1 Tax=[Archangium] primigenium TaxID=2792470 RepID=UPI0019570FC3|nr:sigma-70 family RNA polymerase sigma factor [Archangium primigenium]MBM7119292.1 sigma-70 family RNA polymerase sigma factor [Archangium primigenium]